MNRFLLILASVAILYPLHLTAQSDSLVVADMRREGVTFSHDNSIVIFKNGQEKFDDMFPAIRSAKHTVHLEYFNFRNDSIASLLFDILAEKVKEGVKVRALFDGFGNDSNNQPLKKHHISDLRSRGIEIYEFDPIRFPWVNHIWPRDHRKIVVIDGKIAYTGGMNVADYYIKGTPQVGTWRDMHCRIEGTAVNELQKIFLRIWNKTTDQKVMANGLLQGGTYYTPSSKHQLSECPARHPVPSSARQNTYEIKKIMSEELDSFSRALRFVKAAEPITGSPTGEMKSSLNLSCDKQHMRPDTTASRGKKMVGIVNREPRTTNAIMRRFYCSAIDNAQSEIRIINPYFTLLPCVKKALRRALKRGVRVDILVSLHGDVPLTPDCVFFQCHTLMKCGANIYIYKPGFHHSKIMTVDKTFCTIGSTNLDARSLSGDYEVNTFIVDPHTTAELNSIFDADIKDCFLLTPETWNQMRTRWQKTKGWLAHLLSPFL